LHLTCAHKQGGMAKQGENLKKLNFWGRSSQYICGKAPDSKSILLRPKKTVYMTRYIRRWRVLHVTNLVHCTVFFKVQYSAQYFFPLYYVRLRVISLVPVILFLESSTAVHPLMEHQSFYRLCPLAVDVVTSSYGCKPPFWSGVTSIYSPSCIQYDCSSIVQCSTSVDCDTFNMCFFQPVLFTTQWMHWLPVDLSSPNSAAKQCDLFPSHGPFVLHLLPVASDCSSATPPHPLHFD
jgi:hypothetical protein